MPYASRAQQRFFHAAAARGDISPETVKEYDDATKKAGGFARLPERKARARREGMRRALKRRRP